MSFSALHPANDLWPNEQETRAQVEYPQSFDPTEEDIQNMKLYTRFGGEYWVKYRGERPRFIPDRDWSKDA